MEPDKKQPLITKTTALALTCFVNLDDGRWIDVYPVGFDQRVACIREADLYVVNMITGSFVEEIHEFGHKVNTYSYIYLVATLIGMGGSCVTSDEIGSIGRFSPFVVALNDFLERSGQKLTAKQDPVVQLELSALLQDIWNQDYASNLLDAEGSRYARHHWAEVAHIVESESPHNESAQLRVDEHLFALHELFDSATNILMNNEEQVAAPARKDRH